MTDFVPSLLIKLIKKVQPKNCKKKFNHERQRTEQGIYTSIHEKKETMIINKRNNYLFSNNCSYYAKIKKWKLKN